MGEAILLVFTHVTVAVVALYAGLRIGVWHLERQKEGRKAAAMREAGDLQANIEGRARPAGV